MDKHLHKGIGEQFSEQINSLSQQPSKHIWDTINKELDKTDAANYKEKFTRLRKKTFILLLLLIGISTFSLIYFNASKKTTTFPVAMDNYNTTAQKRQEQIKSEGTTINGDIPKRGIHSANSHTKIQPEQINASLYPISPANKKDNLLAPEKLLITQRADTKTKITIAPIEEPVTETESKNNNRIFFEKLTIQNVLAASAAPINTEKAISKIHSFAERDLQTGNITTQILKNAKKQKKGTPLKFTLTAFAAPDYSGYHLVNDKQNSYDTKGGIENRERSDLSATIGFLFGYKMGKKISFQSGFIYSSSDISISATKVYAEKDNTGNIKYRYNTSSGYGYLLPSFSSSPSLGDSLYADGANHTLRYISIPLIARYEMGGKRIRFNPGVGITFNVLTKSTLTTDLVDRFNRETESITKIESIKKLGASLLLSPEVQYRLSKNWSISALPYFKYSLGAINKGNVVKTYPYTFGAGIGAVYTFK